MRQTNENIESVAKALAKPEENKEERGVLDIEKERAVQELQTGVVMARRFPRDEIGCETLIVNKCRNYNLALKGLFKFPRGGKQVEGPTIRLAEMLASSWQNIWYGWYEITRRRGSSDVMAWAWDLESNVRSFRQFTVEHAFKSGGQIKFLTDPRDIYERVANEGARRQRACILERIPAEVIDIAVKTVRETLLNPPKSVPHRERIKAALLHFESFGVKQEHLEKHLGHTIDLTTPEELVELITIANSLKDGASREQYFDIGLKEIEEGGPAGDLKNRIKANSGETMTASALKEEDLMPWEKEKK